MSRPVLLINTNVLRPPVSPVGLEYVGESLADAGVPVRVLDMVFDDWPAALARETAATNPLLVGLTVRNTDDCSFATRRSLLPWIRDLVAEVRRQTDAFVLLGGAGFSVMPDATLRLSGADAGIAGDAEGAMPALAEALARGGDITGVPNLVRRDGDRIIRNRPVYADLQRLPPRRRNLFDNRAYQETGAMVGLETKRGCPGRCVFCADPVSKGTAIRFRSPTAVAQEFQNLVDQGVTWFHLCDSEFNLPPEHARDVCHAILDAGLGDRLHWYTYASPTPFDRELAILMKRAGCAGVNFGVDSLCDKQLLALGRDHTVDDVARLVRILTEAGLVYMLDLLMGGPGETPETVRTSLDAVRGMNVPLAGIALGVRVYPGTPLGRAVTSGAMSDGLHGTMHGTMQGDIHSHSADPLFYLSPHLGDDAPALVSDLVAGDPRFLFLGAPADAGSYNYADDEGLSQAIKNGARGAYWQIIARGRGQS